MDMLLGNLEGGGGQSDIKALSSPADKSGNLVSPNQKAASS